MKIDIKENSDDFFLTMEAETIEDAAILTRMGLNVKKEKIYFESFCFTDHKFVAQGSIKKKAINNSTIK